MKFHHLGILTVAVMGTAMAAANPNVAAAQSDGSGAGPDDGSAGSAIAGGFLGAYSGGLTANLGSLVWCTETGWGAGCIRTFTLAGSVIGGAAGSILGDRDPDALERTAIRAGIGFGIAGALGILTMEAKGALGWPDVLMSGALGGAVGAKPVGAALGFAGGALSGWALSKMIPDFGLPEIAATAVAGMAVGVLSDWIISASNAGEADGVEALSFSIPIRMSF